MILDSGDFAVESAQIHDGNVNLAGTTLYFPFCRANSIELLRFRPHNVEVVSIDQRG